MTTTTSPQRSKITVRVWTPIFEALVSRTDAACLRRDALISRTLRLELGRIRQEIPYRNTPLVRRSIEASLRKLFASGSGSKQLSLALDPDVAQELDAVCEALNVPRDNLLNRLFLLLSAPGDYLVKSCFAQTPLHYWNTDVIAESPDAPEEIADISGNQFGGLVDVRTLASDMTKHDESSESYDLAVSPLGRIKNIVDDPLRWYRALLQMSYVQHCAMATPEHLVNLERDKYIYTPFGFSFDKDELNGLECYIDERHIIDSPTAFLIHPKVRKASKPGRQRLRLRTKSRRTK